jgi:opacity protein-like surface antigen
MKKIILSAALVLGAAFNAQAADAGSPFKFLLGAGLTFGGDTLINVPFTDGSEDSIKAGGLIQLYGGGEYRFNDAVAVKATLGYHVNDTRAASNGSVRFTRVPLDLLALYNVNDKVRLGVGAQFVSSPELKGSGVASNVSQKYDSTTGAIVEVEYLFTSHLGLELRYVSEKFTPSGGGSKIDGSHGGVMFNYYF